MVWWPGNITSLILFEDKNILVVYKPPTILSQEDINKQDNLFDACKRYLQHKNEKNELGIIHRIDRPCSGIILYSKTSESTVILNEKFQKRKVDKDYLCVVNGKVTENMQCHNKIQKSTSAKVRIFDLNSTRTDVVEAKMRFRPLLAAKKPEQLPNIISNIQPSSTSTTQSDTSTSTDQTLIQVELETGRKHQIRAQLSHIGLPIVGDNKYGAPQMLRNRDICLHAYSLTFNHPISNKQMRIRADVPLIWGKRFGEEILSVTKALVEK
eukprot:gene1915-3716_t